MKKLVILLSAIALIAVGPAYASNQDPGGGAGSEMYCTFHGQIFSWNGTLYQCYYLPYGAPYPWYVVQY